MDEIHKKKSLLQILVEKRKNKPKYDVYVRVEDSKNGLITQSKDMNKMSFAHKNQVISFLMGIIRGLLNPGLDVQIVKAEEQDGE